MKTLNTTLVLFILLYSCKGHTQDYGKEVMKINDYVVKTVGYSKELSDSVEPYQQALGVEGLSFKQYAPDDPQTDDTENVIRIGDKKVGNRFSMSVNEGEWVSGFINYSQDFQISIGSRVFKIGDTKEETLAKLDLGYEFYKNKQNIIRIFYYEASLTIGFNENDNVKYFNFDNLFY